MDIQVGDVVIIKGTGENSFPSDSKSVVGLEMLVSKQSSNPPNRDVGEQTIFQSS